MENEITVRKAKEILKLITGDHVMKNRVRRLEDAVAKSRKKWKLIKMYPIIFGEYIYDKCALCSYCSSCAKCPLFSKHPIKDCTGGADSMHIVHRNFINYTEETDGKLKQSLLEKYIKSIDNWIARMEYSLEIAGL